MEDFVFKDEKVKRENMTVYNTRKKPFRIHGLYHPEKEGLFRRMPEEAAQRVSKRVAALHTNTAGARLRFATDSSLIAVGAIYPPMEFPSPRTAAFAAAGAFSFDLYADGEYKRVLWPENQVQRGSVVSFDIPNGQYEAVCSFGERKMRQITLHFPSFVNISELYVGLEEGATVQEAEPYRNKKPVVFYGSSITQGACASHPGNIYQNILSRRLSFDYLNLGFAGSAKAEDAIVDHLAALDACMFVFDYDHNAKSIDFLKSTHLPALKKLRQVHPSIPFVLLSRPNRDPSAEDSAARAKVVEESYLYLKENYDAPVHFVNGYDVFCSRDSEMMTIDGTHPTDFGFYCMAEALFPIFNQYFGSENND